MCTLYIAAYKCRTLEHSPCSPQAWTFSDPLANPASLYPAEVRTLFDTAFRADYIVQKSILGFDNGGHSFLKDHPAQVAFEAGFGSLYWMEGVVFRLQARP